MAFPIVESSNTGVSTFEAQAALPSGVVAGDLLVFIAAAYTVQTESQWVTPEGWTAVLERLDDAEDLDLGVWYRIADGSEPATQVVERNESAGTNPVAAAYLRISGADPTVPFDAVGESESNANTTNHSAPAVTPTSDDALVLSLIGFHGSDGSPLTFPAPWVVGTQLTSGTASEGVTLAWAQQALATAGTVPTFGITSPVSDGSLTWSLAVRPLRNREPKVVARQTTTQIVTASFVVDLPASITAGNLLLMFVGNDNAFARIALTTGFEPLAGWTQLALEDDDVPFTAGDSTSDAKLGVYYKFATTNEPSTVTVTWGQPAADHWAVVYEISGVDERDPFNGQSDRVNLAPVEPVVITGVATTRPDTLLLAAFCNDRSIADLNVIETESPGWELQERLQAGNSGAPTNNAIGITLARAQSPSSPASDISIDFGEAVAGVGLQVALNAAIPYAGPTFEQSNLATNALAVTSVDVAQPGTVNVGDFLLIFGGSKAIGGLFTSLEGWVELYNEVDADADVATAAWYRIADGTEPATETIEHAVAGPTYAVYLRASGVDPTFPLDVEGPAVTQTADTTSHPVAAVAPTLPSTLGIAIIAFDAGDTIPTTLEGSGWLLSSVNAGVSGTGASGAFARKQIAQRFDSGPVTFQPANGQTSRARMITLKAPPTPDVVLPDVNPARVIGSSAAGNASNADTLDVPIPTDVEPGELLLLYAFSNTADDAQSFEVPLGWTLIWQGVGESASGGAVAQFWRIAELFDSETVRLTFSNATSILSAMLVRVDGADAVSPIHVLGAPFLDDASADGTVTVPEGTSTIDGVLALAFNVSEGDDAAPFFVQPATGFVKAAEQVAGQASFVVASKSIPTADKAGAVSIVPSVPARSFARQVLVAPGPLVQARQTSQLLQRMLDFLPGYYEPDRPLLAAFAGALARAELDVDRLFVRAGIGTSQGIWLSLQGDDIDVPRAAGELDAQYRPRLRDGESRVTRPAILSVVNTLLEPFTDQQATMIEWFESDSFADVGAYADINRITQGPPSFLLVVPPLEGGLAAPIFNVIIAAVNRLKLGGVGWVLVSSEG